jgi:hypothetical protein
MTKLNWDKANRYERDPGSVVDVPESTERWTTPEERKRRVAERADKNRELCRKSEEHDFQLLISGQLREIQRKQDLGIPLSGWDKLTLKHHDQL